MALASPGPVVVCMSAVRCGAVDGGHYSAHTTNGSPPTDGPEITKRRPTCLPLQNTRPLDARIIIMGIG